ncbi:MAG: protoheme IX farnesyltransferase [Sandaracinus sp.]|nr:protoheme IX farnesyltransferase [Sandaracinus sp.]MCB9633467.1 protoheme IX farnesyltransferase [Sandaracinus sp.]
MATTTETSIRPSSSVLRDVIALTKPRITLMVVITAAGGMWLAPDGLPLGRALLMLLTTAAVVGAANALNCWLERDSDRLMARTMKRPLPDGRLEPKIALWLGIALGLTSVPLLTFGVNALTGLLGAIALVSYVAIYTPMKRASSVALLIGAVPGALPPLMGWTAATGSLDAPGLALFAILFFWQIPHFIAIALFRQADYDRAGLKTLPSERGPQAAKVQAVVYTGLLVVSSLLLYVFRVAGVLYLATAIVLGILFFAASIANLKPGVAPAKKLFFVSLIYLTLLFVALGLDTAIRA